MTEPAAGIFATFFALAAGVMISLAARGRFRLSYGRARRICPVLFAIAYPCIGLEVLCMSSPPIFGLPWAIREPVALIGVLTFMVTHVIALILISAEPTMLAAYLHMPTQLYTWLYGESDHHDSADAIR